MSNLPFTPDLDTPLPLASSSFEKQAHLFLQEQVDAVNAALLTRRPLLVCGKPGVGKSQLARAAASELGRVFIKHVVDAKTEAHDLLWWFDAVGRLAAAQTGEKDLPLEAFLHPGPLWWAFNWTDALGRAGTLKIDPPPQPDNGLPEKGAVVLIDEIDKAEADVPNALLEALGSGRFRPPGTTRAIEMNRDLLPLVIITSNGERSLPPAFVRRCLVLHMALPEGKGLSDYLRKIGRAHFGDFPESLMTSCIDRLEAQRKEAANHNRNGPGQAEFIDLLRLLDALGHGSEEQKTVLQGMDKYLLEKHNVPGI